MPRAAGKLASRSETVGVRLDPKVRYLAEVGARIQGRSLSSFIEWSILRVLRVGEIPDGPNAGHDIPLELRLPKPMANEELWDEDEIRRFWKLATHPSGLLYEPEQKLWNAYSDGGGSPNNEEQFRKRWPALKAKFLEGTSSPKDKGTK